MGSKAMGVKGPGAKTFLTHVSAAMPGSSPTARLEDAVCQLADQLASQVRSGHLDVVLQAVELALEETLERRFAERSARSRNLPGTRAGECDPFYWG